MGRLFALTETTAAATATTTTPAAAAVGSGCAFANFGFVGAGDGGVLRGRIDRTIEVGVFLRTLRVRRNCGFGVWLAVAVAAAIATSAATTASVATAITIAAIGGVGGFA